MLDNLRKLIRINTIVFQPLSHRRAGAARNLPVRHAVRVQPDVLHLRRAEADGRTGLGPAESSAATEPSAECLRSTIQFGDASGTALQQS